MSSRVTIQYGYYPQPRSPFRFGKDELLNIGMAVGALTLAFSILYLDPLAGGYRIYSNFAIAIIFLFSLIAVLTGFLMHELAHKYVAVKYGCWAEFRASTRGLLIAIFTALFGFVFAAPGAVMVYGSVNTEQNGKISVAGPLTNLIFGGGFFALLLVLVFFNQAEPDLLVLLAYQVTIVNLILGAFNMIPVLPFDGAKIWHWKKFIWIGMTAVFVVAIIAFFMLPYII